MVRKTSLYKKGPDGQTAMDAARLARRELVARYKPRGLTLYGLQMKLTEEGLINPATEEPWSIPVISKDVKALKEEWQERARRSTDEWKKDLLDEIHELRRAAWEKLNFREILNSIKRECDMYGLDAKKEVGVKLYDVLENLPEDYAEGVRAALNDAISETGD